METDKKALESLEKHVKELVEFFNSQKMDNAVVIPKAKERSLEMLNGKFKENKNDNLYCFYVKNDESWKPIYVGQSKSKFFLQRMHQHFHKEYLGTASKFKNLKGVNEVRVKSVQIIPEELRHYFEQKMIHEFKPKYISHGNIKSKTNK